MKCKDCIEEHCFYRTNDVTKECYYSIFAEEFSKISKPTQVFEKAIESDYTKDASKWLKIESH